jgi:hypothetical protein
MAKMPKPGTHGLKDQGLSVRVLGMVDPKGQISAGLKKLIRQDKPEK